jgi:hypothetical protein
MNLARASALSPNAPPRRNLARTAIVGLKEPHRALLAECFRQFGIETVSLAANAAERLKHEKFEACVLGLGGTPEPVFEALRASSSNSRCILYAVGGTALEGMRFSKYGVNAVFSEPLERTAAMKIVRSTRSLLLHEFRRYIRIPVVTEVSVAGDGRRVVANSIEMSAGGMSLQSHEDFSAGTTVEISFALLSMPRVIVRGAVTWHKPKSFGVRFDLNDDRRQPIKRWIDSYLEN